jgi:hypothetical protein
MTPVTTWYPRGTCPGLVDPYTPLPGRRGEENGGADDDEAL